MLLVFLTVKAQASELLGKISTNPNQAGGTIDKPPVGTTTNPNIIQKKENQYGGNYLITLLNLEKTKENKKILYEIKVLGLTHYDRALLRGKNKKIYYVVGQVKKYITSLAELRKYKKQIIFNVSDEELAQYQERKYIDGDLIREKDIGRIYTIKNGKKNRIFSMMELRTKYSGLKIYDLSPEEIKLY
jgi:hypothetical protein